MSILLELLEKGARLLLSFLLRVDWVYMTVEQCPKMYFNANNWRFVNNNFFNSGKIWLFIAIERKAMINIKEWPRYTPVHMDELFT